MGDNNCFFCESDLKCYNLLNNDASCDDEEYSLGTCLDMKEYGIIIFIAVFVIICAFIIGCKCYQKKEKRKKEQVYKELNEEYCQNAMSAINEKNTQNSSNISVNVTTTFSMPPHQPYPYATT